MRMRLTILHVAIGVASTVVVTAATAEGQGPYQQIAERNVFRLSEPVVSVIVPQPPPIVLPKITLTGITTILGRRIVFLTVAGTRPHQAAESFMLSEGQGLNEIEVRSIDERAGVVTVLNHGQSQVLNFEHDGAKPAVAPAEPVSNQRVLPRPALPLPSARTEATLTPEEQVALIEIQRVKYQQENNSTGKILPPTEMTPETLGEH